MSQLSEEASVLAGRWGDLEFKPIFWGTAQYVAEEWLGWDDLLTQASPPTPFSDMPKLEE